MRQKPLPISLKPVTAYHKKIIVRLSSKRSIVAFSKAAIKEGRVQGNLRPTVNLQAEPMLFVDEKDKAHFIKAQKAKSQMTLGQVIYYQKGLVRA